MALRFFGPRLNRGAVTSRISNRITRTFDSILFHYTKSSMDSPNFTATIANGPLGRGSKSSDNQCRMGNAGSPDRYYLQFIDDDNTTQTVVSNSGVSALPALIAAHPVMVNYISMRVVGSFGSNDVIYPTTEPGSTTAAFRFFKGGRG